MGIYKVLGHNCTFIVHEILVVRLKHEKVPRNSLNGKTNHHPFPFPCNHYRSSYPQPITLT